MRKMLLAFGLVALVAVVVVAQTKINPTDPQPTCAMCPGYYIPVSELQAYTQKAIEEKLIDQQVRELFAAGSAAPIAADGEAMSASLAEVSAAWRESGGRAMDMFVLQHLDQIFGDVADAAKRLKVAQVNLIDGGDGKTIPAYAAAYPATMSALLEQVQKTLGVDIAKVVTGQSGERS